MQVFEMHGSGSGLSTWRDANVRARFWSRQLNERAVYFVLCNKTTGQAPPRHRTPSQECDVWTDPVTSWDGTKAEGLLRGDPIDCCHSKIARARDSGREIPGWFHSCIFNARRLVLMVGDVVRCILSWSSAAIPIRPCLVGDRALSREIFQKREGHAWPLFA